MYLILNFTLFVAVDVVVIVGDLTDSQVTRLRIAAEPLGQMKAQLGSYFATGLS